RKNGVPDGIGNGSQGGSPILPHLRLLHWTMPAGGILPREVDRPPSGVERAICRARKACPAAQAFPYSVSGICCCRGAFSPAAPAVGREKRNGSSYRATRST